MLSNKDKCLKVVKKAGANTDEKLVMAPEGSCVYGGHIPGLGEARAPQALGP